MFKQPIVTYKTHHLVKSEDLNHHRTLFAGRTAEWFVEAGFIAAAYLVKPNNIVCVQLHGMRFFNAVKLGSVICFESKVIYTGRTSIYTHVRVMVNGHQEVDGFVTFVHVDENNKALPHEIEMVATTEDDLKLQKEAEKLKNNLTNKDLQGIEPALIDNAIKDIMDIIKENSDRDALEKIRTNFLVVKQQDLIDSYGK